MHFTRTLRYSLSVVAVAALAGGLFSWRPINAAPETAASPGAVEDVLAHVGVVDIERLVRANPEYAKLEQIDQEIGYLSAQIESSGPSQDEIVKSMRKQLDAMKARLVEKFQVDLAGVKADLDARKAAVESTLKAEAASISSQMEAYQEELKRKAGGGPISVGPSADTKVRLEAEMARATEPLLLVARQKVAAKQLEIQQAVESQMQDAKRQMDARLAEQMDEVLKADQQQKLQIQLDMQTATDEETRRKLQEQLQALNEKEEARRDALRAELAAEFDKKRKAAIGRHQAEIQAYGAKVKRDVDAQIRARQAAVLSKYGVASAGTTQVSNLQAALQMKQRELKARFEARKDSLIAGLQAASAQAQARLRAEQKDIEKKLKAEQQRIIADAVKAQGRISKDEKARRERLMGQLDELKVQRDRVYDGIVAQIRDMVSKLAAEQKVPLVVGDYRVNIKCTDLTELALKQATGDATSPSTPSGQ